MSDTSQLDRLLGSAGEANGEFMAKAAFILAQFDLPHTGEDAAVCAASAAAGCLLVDIMAKMAVSHGLMAPSTGAAIEGLVGRAVEAWAALAIQEHDDDGRPNPEPDESGIA